jgi:hypothetical protein
VLTVHTGTETLMIDPAVEIGATQPREAYPLCVRIRWVNRMHKCCSICRSGFQKG